MNTSTGSTSGVTAKIKLFTGPGTRRWPRFSISDLPSIGSVRSSTGSEIKVANISRGGVLLRTRSRLLPRARIQLNLVIEEGIVPLTGLVVRSSIASPKDTPRYLAAVAFDHPLQMFDDSLILPANGLHAPLFAPPFGAFPSDILPSSRRPIQDEDSVVIATFFALNVCSAHDPALQELFKLNDW